MGTKDKDHKPLIPHMEFGFSLPPSLLLPSHTAVLQSHYGEVANITMSYQKFTFSSIALSF